MLRLFADFPSATVTSIKYLDNTVNIKCLVFGGWV